MHEVTVKSVKYTDGNIYVVSNMPGYLDHVSVIPPGAVGSRMVLYGLATPKEALTAILREHCSSLATDIADPTTRDELVARMKTDLAAIVVTIPPTATPDAVLTLLSLEIEEARELRLPTPVPIPDPVPLDPVLDPILPPPTAPA